jgi:hypothetical protein
MKKIMIIIWTVLGFTFSSYRIYGDYHIQPDKKLHLEAGIIIGGASYLICPKLEELVFDKSRIYPAIWSIGMAGLAGAAKEIIYDDWMGRGYPDIKDFYYTLMGGAISGLTLGIFETMFNGINNNVCVKANPLNKNIIVSYFHYY